MHHYKYSLNPKKKLEEACNLLNFSQTKAKLDVKTRWGSTLKMIERYLILEPAIQYLSAGNKNLKEKDKDYILNDNILSIQENILIEKFVSILKEVENASEYISQTLNSSLSEVLIIMSGLASWFGSIINKNKKTDMLIESQDSSYLPDINSSKALFEFIDEMKKKMDKVYIFKNKILFIYAYNFYE